MNEAKFPLGRIVATANAASVLTQYDLETGLLQHVSGEWGDLDEHDRQENEKSLKNGTRLLSAYCSITGIRYWIITEHDRSATTVLLPEDY